MRMGKGLIALVVSWPLQSLYMTCDPCTLGFQETLTIAGNMFQRDHAEIEGDL